MAPGETGKCFEAEQGPRKGTPGRVMLQLRIPGLPRGKEGRAVLMTRPAASFKS